MGRLLLKGIENIGVNAIRLAITSDAFIPEVNENIVANGLSVCLYIYKLYPT